MVGHYSLCISRYRTEIKNHTRERECREKTEFYSTRDIFCAFWVDPMRNVTVTKNLFISSNFSAHVCLFSFFIADANARLASPVLSVNIIWTNANRRRVCMAYVWTRRMVFAVFANQVNIRSFLFIYVIYLTVQWLFFRFVFLGVLVCMRAQAFIW